MNDKLKNIRISKANVNIILENVYLIIFAIFLGEAFLWTTTFVIDWPANFYSDIKDLMIVLIILRMICSEHYNLKEIILVTIVSIAFLFIWRRNGSDLMFNTFLFIIGSRGISFDKIMKVYVTVIGGLLVITIWAALTGHIENLVYVQAERPDRQSFGVCYPTDFAAHVFYLLLGYCYIRRKIFRYIEVFGVMIIGILIYIFCNARVSTICIFLLCAGMLYYKLRSQFCEKHNCEFRLNNIMSTLLAMSAVLASLFMIGMSILYSPDNKFYLLLDKLVNKRLKYGSKGIQIYGFSLFGQDIPMRGYGGSVQKEVWYFFLDSSYLSIVLRYGTLFLAAVLFIWCVIGFRAQKEQEWLFLWIIALVSLHSMIEHHMVDLSYNPFLWAIFAETSIAKIKPHFGGVKHSYEFNSQVDKRI